MGYYMDQRDSSFQIKKEYHDKALAAVKGLTANKEKYQWIRNENINNADTLAKAFVEWRWEIRFDEKGNIIEIKFTGEKSGDDFELFCVIAPYVEDGSFIEMQGEDGILWRWVFEKGECIERYGEESWI